jgi:hypothetical protein
VQAKKMECLKETLGILMLILVVSCQVFDKSQNRLIKEYYNPKSSMKVIVFEKLGNATVNNSIQASIHEYDYELKNEDVGNVFVADKIEGIKSVDSILIANWIDNETVEFIHPKNIRAFKTESEFENNVGKVRIEYKTNK